MASQPAEQLGRMLDLIPYIYAHQGILKSDLAQEFGVSVEELEANLFTLWKCGLPPYTPGDLLELEFEGDEVWVRDADALKRPRGLIAAEVTALILGLQLIANETVSDEVQEQILRLTKKLQPRDSAPSIEVGSGSTFIHREVIEAAIATGSKLEITYNSLTRDDVTVRQIAPFTIATSKLGEEVEAYCFTSQGYRTFRAERIKSVKALQRAEKRAEVENQSAPMLSVKMKIHSRLREVLEKFPATKSDSTIAVKLPATSTLSAYPGEWAIRSAVSLGTAIEVLEPTSLRKEIATFAQKGLDRY
jgi:proteasome accessory factor C